MMMIIINQNDVNDVNDDNEIFSGVRSTILHPEPRSLHRLHCSINQCLTALSGDNDNDNDDDDNDDNANDNDNDTPASLQPQQMSPCSVR